jgi:hypothetical protein
MTKFVIIRAGGGGVHLAPREAWRDEPRHAREGSDFAPVLRRGAPGRRPTEARCGSL